jgi:hypothetical protein
VQEIVVFLAEIARNADDKFTGCVLDTLMIEQTPAPA